MATFALAVVMGLAGGLAGCGASLNEGAVSAAATDGGARPAASFTSAAGPSTVEAAPSAVGASSMGKIASEMTASATPGNTGYKIGPLDVVEVSVFKVPELSKSVQVANTGTINLPLVGEVPAAGLTAQEVERDLTKRLGGKYLQSPQVTVFVKEYNSQRVTIEGAVKKPGVYPIRGQSTLLQIIATAEGVTDLAESEVAIFRDTDGKRSGAKFNLDDIRSGAAQDPVIQKGDTVVVSTSVLAKTYQNLLKALPIGSFVALL